MASRKRWRVPEGWQAWWAARPWRRVRAADSLRLAAILLFGLLAVWAINAHYNGTRHVRVLSSAAPAPRQIMGSTPSAAPSAAASPAPRGTLYLAVENPGGERGKKLDGYGRVDEVVGRHVVWLVPRGEFDSIPAVLPHGTAVDRFRVGEDVLAYGIFQPAGTPPRDHRHLSLDERELIQALPYLEVIAIKPAAVSALPSDGGPGGGGGGPMGGGSASPSAGGASPQLMPGGGAPSPPASPSGAPATGGGGAPSPIPPAFSSPAPVRTGAAPMAAPSGYAAPAP